jgi:ribosome biogenesis protein Nip4
MRLLRKFLNWVGSTYDPMEEQVLKLNNKRFLLQPELAELDLHKDKLVYAGKLLGRDRKFFQPSSTLLSELAKEEATSKVYLGRDAAWLFVCGKDVFEENIQGVDGELVLGGYYLVVFDDDCVGYGQFIESGDIRVIKNLFDIGDFLRRER